jgi:hypothetical protein
MQNGGTEGAPRGDGPSLKEKTRTLLVDFNGGSTGLVVGFRLTYSLGTLFFHVSELVLYLKYLYLKLQCSLPASSVTARPRCAVRSTISRASFGSTVASRETKAMTTHPYVFICVVKVEHNLVESPENPTTRNANMERAVSTPSCVFREHCSQPPVVK